MSLNGTGPTGGGHARLTRRAYKRHKSAMIGQTDLPTLLATLEPSLSETEFAFGTIADPTEAHAIQGIIATFAEDEGLSVVAPAEALATAGILQSRGWAMISLKVHSSLSAIGLTAALTSSLADKGISANVVAGFFHDHLFVDWEHRHRALAILSTLAAAASCTNNTPTPH